MNKNNLKLAKERYLRVKEISKEDSNVSSLLESLVGSATRYVCHVANMEAQIKRNSVDSRESTPSFYLRERARLRESLDSERRIYHNALISRLSALNRYLFNEFPDEIPAGGIYSLDPESIRDRRYVGTWAGNLVSAIKDLNKKL